MTYSGLAYPAHSHGAAGAYGHWGSTCCQPMVPVIAYVCLPQPCSPCPPCTSPTTVPHEIEVAPGDPAETALLGGTSDLHLTVETYVAAGAASPSVKVTIDADGSSSTWTDTGIAQGYHVHESVLTTKPGALVTLTSSDATARVRWCETVCC